MKGKYNLNPYVGKIALGFKRPRLKKTLYIKIIGAIFERKRSKQMLYKQILYKIINPS